MKKIILFAFLVVFSLSAFAINPDSKSDRTVTPDKKENKLSENEINRLSKRVDETRSMEKSKQVVVVREGHRRGHEGMHRDNRRSGGVVFVGGGAVLLVILIILLV